MLIDEVKKLPNKPTIKEVAKVLGVSEQFLRIGFQMQRLPFGEAVKVGRKKRWTYCVFRDRLLSYLGGADNGNI